MEPESPGLIKVVGMSASGKSSLVRALRERGYGARPISQEHSNVPELWRQFDKPDVLIHLDASLACQRQRRPDVSWTRRYHAQEAARLQHARDHADLRVDTSGMEVAEVLAVVLIFLKRQRVAHADAALPPITPTGGARRN